jgi:hypothetical protein
MGLSMTANFIIFALPMVIAAIATLRVRDEAASPAAETPESKA